MGALTVSISVPGEHDVGSRAQNLFERRVGAVTVGQGRHRPVAVNLRQGVGLALDPRCRDDLVAGADGQHHRDHVAVVDEQLVMVTVEGPEALEVEELVWVTWAQLVRAMVRAAAPATMSGDRVMRCLPVGMCQWDGCDTTGRGSPGHREDGIGP